MSEPYVSDLTDAELADIVWSVENFTGRAWVGILVSRTEVLALVDEVRRRRASAPPQSADEGLRLRGALRDLAMELTLACNSFENAVEKMRALSPEKMAVLRRELDASRELARPHLPPEPWRDSAPCHRRALSPSSPETPEKESKP